MSNTVAHKLLRTFFKRSFWITVILALILSIVVPLVIYRYHLRQYEAESAALLNRFIQREICFSPHDLLDNPKSLEATVSNINVFMEFGDLVEFRLWSTDATLIYSYHAKPLVGHRFPNNPRLIKTLRSGKTFVEIEDTRDSENSDLAEFGTLVEIYAPVFVDGTVRGAAEVYRKAPKFELLTAHIVLVVSTAVVIFMLLYVLLYGRFKAAATSIIAYDDKLQGAYRSLGLSYFDTIRSLIKALELRDMETEGHSERVVAISLFIGERLGIPADELDKLVLGSYLHDIGKIGVPDSILLKPGGLSPEEEMIIHSHVEKGLEIISTIEFLGPAAEVVRYHHEKWDGTGYSAGLNGAEIPLTARIFAVVDVFDALISERPYRRPMSFEAASVVIQEGRGKHFDPEIVDVFMGISQEEYARLGNEIVDRGIHHTVNAAVENLLCRLNVDGKGD
ncbi:HD-GYP domain-containing protein [Geobacter pickeringii]|uniref:HD-GYP domain-containing protein n=1 Tax=Geobacter pickeringii TaxID=345632 RepID=UPI000689493D|nr:HD-GYP domain-containing protein [Geobacter pickeringii]